MTEKQKKPKGRKPRPISAIHPISDELMKLAESRGINIQRLSRMSGIGRDVISAIRSPTITSEFSKGTDPKFAHIDLIAQALGKKLVLVDIK